jgi:hypothetical protein
MKTQQNPVINFQNPEDVIYWSKKWEVSPMKLFYAFTKTQSNDTETIKKYLRNDGFAL